MKLIYENVEKDVKIYADRSNIGKNVHFGNGVRIVAEQLDIEDDVFIGDQSDLRSMQLHIGASTSVGSRASVLCPELFRVDEGSRFESGSVIQSTRVQIGSEFYFGFESAVGYGGRFGSQSSLRIGNQVAISSRNVLNTSAPIEIGDRAGTSDDVYVLTHGLHHSHSVLKGYPLSYSPVSIGQEVWLGMRVIVLPGVTIGRRSIIGAASVVTKDIPAEVLAAGVPAIVKRQLVDSPLPDERQLELLDIIVQRWLQDLSFKGAKGISAGRIDDVWTYDFIWRDRSYRLILDGSGYERLLDQGSDELIVIGRSRATAASIERATFFDLETQVAAGVLNEVAEDLRDFLRRNSLSCFNGTKFCSLPREDLRKLLSAC